MSIIEYIGSIGGVAGVLAFVIFMAYRHLANQVRIDRKFMEDRLTKVIGAYNKTISKNTKVQSELVTLIKRLNGRLK